MLNWTCTRERSGETFKLICRVFTVFHSTFHHRCEINLLVEDLALEADGINPCQFA